MALGDTRMSALTAHLLFFHAPLLVLRFPSKFDCKTFTDRVCEHQVTLIYPQD